jgi:hypothetical protein
MNRGRSPWTPRSMPGHGLRMTSRPPWFGGSSSPFSLTTAASTPKNGSVHEPGTVGVAPGSGVIMWPPVSVCHQVSTTGQRPPPTTSRYHIQASGLIGSPTVPSSASRDRSCFFTCASPALRNERIAVGAV